MAGSLHVSIDIFSVLDGEDEYLKLLLDNLVEHSVFSDAQAPKIYADEMFAKLWIVLQFLYFLEDALFCLRLKLIDVLLELFVEQERVHLRCNLLFREKFACSHALEGSVELLDGLLTRHDVNGLPHAFHEVLHVFILASFYSDCFAHSIHQ